MVGGLGQPRRAALDVGASEMMQLILTLTGPSRFLKALLGRDAFPGCASAGHVFVTIPLY